LNALVALTARGSLSPAAGKKGPISTPIATLESKVSASQKFMDLLLDFGNLALYDYGFAEPFWN
jgi:hypothetical protein